MAILIVTWWSLSLVFVRICLQIPFVISRLDAVREMIPAAGKYAQSSNDGDASTLFYLFFLLTTPVAAIWYLKVTRLTKALGGRVTLILWLLVAVCIYFLTLGIDFSAANSAGFRRTFHFILSSSWFGSSFFFLLCCHCLVLAVACLSRNKRRSFS